MQFCKSLRHDVRNTEEHDPNMKRPVLPSFLVNTPFLSQADEYSTLLSPYFLEGELLVFNFPGYNIELLYQTVESKRRLRKPRHEVADL